ncbi:MAG: DUF4328 domain-containing protein [Acidobacteria bacterium]|nr:DUF4328 domain-containing protein [Acidobacteriota bacterium]
MQSLTDQNYLQLFLEARELPAGLQLTQDSRMRGSDPNDETFRRCLGLRSGLVAWQAPINSTIERIVDIRWVFPSEDMAMSYHQQTLQTNCENMPYLQNVPLVGTECYVFGGRVDMGLAQITSYIYLFRVKTVIVKFYVAQGEGQNLPINTIATLAQNVFNRISSVLAAQAQNQMPQNNPYANPNPYQQTAQTQQQNNPYPFAQPPQTPQGQANYGFSPQGQPIYPQGQAIYQSSQPPSIAYPPKGDYSGSIQQPGSALAISYAILGTLTWLISLPVYILFMALTLDGRLSGGDEEVLAVTFVLTILMAIPTGILFLIWLYKTWEAVPERYRSTSPGKALGFLFIPFFNMYWIFRAFPGLSKSIEKAHRAINPSSAGSGGFVVGMIACVINFIPFLNILSFIPFMIWVLVTNNAKNKMLRDYLAQSGYR